MAKDKKVNGGGFDLVLIIPCLAIPEIEKGNTSNFASFKRGFKDEYVNVKLDDGTKKLPVKNCNQQYNIGRYAKIFREQMIEHSDYELIFDENIKTRRKSLLFGNVIIYEDKKEARTDDEINEEEETETETDEDDEINEEEERSKLNPKCCYNFFCVLSRLTTDKKNRSNDNTFNIIYFIVPDINYADLTLLMDQSHNLWCSIKGNADKRMYLTEYLHEKMGYQYFGKIYHIVFSDSNQFKKEFPDSEQFLNEKNKDDNTKKLFNILAAETRKPKGEYSHQLELSDNTDEYVLNLSRGKITKETNLIEKGNIYELFAVINLAKKEKFYDEYNMYSSYKTFASLYTYYYVIDENQGKPTFFKRIRADESDEGFSSEANILFVLETELFKVTACFVLSNEITKQIHNSDLDLKEIQKMFKRFIETRPLFEKLNYRYLGAQKEADFIYKQFQIGDIIADYDRKRELLRNYSETINSIVADKTSKTLQETSQQTACDGLLINRILIILTVTQVTWMLIEQVLPKEWKLVMSLGVAMLTVLLIFRPLEKLLKRLLNTLKKTSSSLLGRLKSASKRAGD